MIDCVRYIPCDKCGKLTETGNTVENMGWYCDECAKNIKDKHKETNKS